MSAKKIKVVGKMQPKIRDTGKGQPLVDHDLVAKALGAERVTVHNKTTEHLHVVMDSDIMDKVKDYSARERRPVSVVVRDVLIEKLRASGYEI